MPTRVDVLRRVPNEEVDERVRIIGRDPRVVEVRVEPDDVPGTSRITVTMELGEAVAVAGARRTAARSNAAATKKTAAKKRPARTPSRTDAKAKKTPTAKKTPAGKPARPKRKARPR
ncbi:hypothetical protein K2Z84_18625 [Candidatus Binatia bacterium]|nr:hypothetical protein [Candidatus Binatia bacterium]